MEPAAISHAADGCARGASSRGSRVGWITCRRVVVGRWSVVGARLGSARPPPRHPWYRAEEAGQSQRVVQPPPPLSPSHHHQCPAVAASGTRRAGRVAGWPPNNSTGAEVGQSETQTGRRRLFSRPGQLITDPTTSQVQVPVGEVAKRRADLERGEGGWMHALRGCEGGPVPCIPTSRARSEVVMIGPDEIHRGAWRCGTSSVWLRASFFFLSPSMPWVCVDSVEAHERPWRPIQGAYERSLERGGGLPESGNLGWWLSARKKQKQKAVGRRGRAGVVWADGWEEEERRREASAVANGSFELSITVHFTHQWGGSGCTPPVPDCFLFCSCSCSCS
ncbi:hypothetical protein QBC39DRAFT_170052 [Podospora conica]|nr:hypothetical protein QBC39DRAFT_170052 [Schizothecium conicum]